MIQQMQGFNDFVNQVMDEWKVQGLAIAIIKDGEVVLSQGFGLRNVKEGLKATSETLFAIGSCTKAFTTTAMGILVDEGKLDWDKPVRDYLPNFRMYDPYVTEHMTPRDLVTHRSGLPRHDLLWYGASLTREELFDRLRYLEPSKGFRSVYQYQNLMYMTAGYLVGQITDSTWEDFVQKRILKPLGMENSNFSVTNSQESPDYALPYNKEEDKVSEIPFRNIDSMGPAGSINSSVSDMSKWILFHLEKEKQDEKKIISEANLNQTYTPQMVIQEPLKHDELLNSSYGMGWFIQPYRGRGTTRHGGGIDGFSALVSLMPHDNIGMVILTNLGGNPIPPIIAFNVYDRLLGLDQIPWNQRTKEQVEKSKEEAEKAKEKAAKKRKTGTQPSHPLEDYAGEFEHPGYGIISVEVEDDHLKGTYNSMSRALEHYHYDTFTIKMWNSTTKSAIAFSIDAHGNIGSLSISMEPAVKPIVFNRKESGDNSGEQ